MASNPMQRKARNSFLLGMLLMLVITGIIIAFLFLQIKLIITKYVIYTLYQLKYIFTKIIKIYFKIKKTRTYIKLYRGEVYSRYHPNYHKNMISSENLSYNVTTVNLYLISRLILQDCFKYSILGVLTISPSL